MLSLSLEGFRPHLLLRLRSALGCHPERSEGSAFLSTSFVSSFRNLQTFQHSSLSTLPRAIPFRIRTYKKTGGGGPPSNAGVAPANSRYTTGSMLSTTVLDTNWLGHPRSIAAGLLESDGHRAIIDPGPASTLPCPRRHGVSGAQCRTRR